MPRKGQETPSTARLNLIVGLETTASIDEARAALKRLRVFVSVSQLFEIAVQKLLALEKNQLAALLRREGATARRPSKKTKETKAKRKRH